MTAEGSVRVKSKPKQNNLQKIKVNDRVWDIIDGNGIVISVSAYEIEVYFESTNHTRWYTKNGYRIDSDDTVGIPALYTSDVHKVIIKKPPQD